MSSLSYKAFGSFFSDSVPDLLNRTAPRYPRPTAIITEDKEDNDHQVIVPGKPSSRSLFLIDFDNITFLNHGAFGSPFKFAFHEAQKWREHCELDPLRFLDREMFSYWCDSLDALAEFLCLSNSNGLVLVPNATFALWSALKSLVSPGDEVLIMSLTYGSTKKMLAHLGAQVNLVDIQLPVKSAAQIVEAIMNAVTERTKVAVLDHITSNTALVLPVKEISDQLRQKGVLVIVDGAHSLASIADLKIEEIGCHVYLGNCHKWLCCSRGVGFLWKCSADIKISPAVVSHGISESDVQSQFLWIGNMDYSALLTLPSVLLFWKNKFGVQRLIQHQSELIDYAVKQWKATFNMEDVMLVSNELRESFIGPMVLLKLPRSISEKFSLSAKSLQDHLYSERIEVPVKHIQEDLYLRVSFHIYNSQADIDQLLLVLSK